MTTPKARLTTSWFLLIFAVLFHSSATAQVLINLEWQQGNGAPSEIIDYSVSAIAENGCLVVAGNTVTSGEGLIR